VNAARSYIYDRRLLCKASDLLSLDVKKLRDRNSAHENVQRMAHRDAETGALKTRDWKTRNWKTRHQMTGVENAGPENGGTSKLWKAVAVENVQHS